MRPFFSEKGSASKGIDFSLRAVTDYEAFCEGSIGLSEFLDSFLNDMPFVPVCYRSGFAAYKKGLKPDFSYSSDHLYAAEPPFGYNIVFVRFMVYNNNITGKENIAILQYKPMYD